MARWEELAYIAAHCARTYPGNRSLSAQDRYDAALDAIIEELAANGWPDDDKPLFRAGSNGIDRAEYENGKHLRHNTFWHNPHGDRDALAEKVTDRLAVWQIVGELSDAEWEAVWAVAHTGSKTAAAELLGLTVPTLRARLQAARRRAAGLWVCPGEAPFGPYQPYAGGKASKARVWRDNQQARARRLAAA